MLRRHRHACLELLRKSGQMSHYWGQFNRFGTRAEDEQSSNHKTENDGGLFMAVGDASLGQVVRRQFQGDTVAGQYANAIPAQFARQVGEHGAVLIQLNAEKAAGKFFNYGSCDFNAIFFAHCPPTAIITSGPTRCVARGSVSALNRARQ
jgi:hypothetical protein